MFLNWLRAIVTLLLTVVLTYALNTKLGMVPPLGKFVNPFGGFWTNAEPKTVTDKTTLKLGGLHAKATVLFDDNLVPHIFARNAHDLYYIQGYITAKHRLWQMELQTYFAAGRVSEVVGERGMELDRYNRQMGMVFGAQQSLKAMMADPQSREITQAYSDGVNAYIESLRPSRYPLEYKVLDYAPEPWTPLKCALLLKLMASTLSGGSDDFRMTNALNKYGPATIRNLFPDYPFLEDPIVPAGTKWDFQPVPVPAVPKDYTAKMTDRTPLNQPDLNTGSNNWAISGQKSATGYPILANDPHLELTLPSIWYQVQLNAPDINVYGASLPGAPNVIIGFNQKIAWGVTNVGSDVLDWYQIKFKDANKNQYWHDNRWKPVQKLVEVIKVRGKADIIDTVRYTHHGPIVYEEGDKPMNKNVPIGHALRWAAHEPSNEMLAFFKMNRAKNYKEYTEALRYYYSPAQNFIFASADNDIAIWPNGRFPLKWKEQGKFILDGSNPAHDWQSWIPMDQNPHVKNPPRGFVSSANQFSADTTYPYYLNWRFDGYERGTRINERLAAMQKATPDSLRLLQTDNLSVLARNVLPHLLSYVSPNQLNDIQLHAYAKVKDWNYHYEATEISPTIFTLWWELFQQKLWDDDFGSTDELPLRYPTRDRTIQLIRTEPTSPWIDVKTTEAKETLADLSTQSFRLAVDSLYRRFGEMDDDWQWALYKNTYIAHLSRSIPAFGRYNLKTGGGGSIVNATTEKNGPSWRMVVALGPNPKGYGIFPGGQSGNPGSFYYDNMVDTWVKGQLNELLYLWGADQKNNRIISVWELE